MGEIRILEINDGALSWEISDIAGFFHATCFHAGLGIAGSGFAKVLATAKKIAFAEANERFLTSQLNTTADKAAWKLDFDESASGFAAGYSSDKSFLRAICEGCERWTLSNWIDQNLMMEELQGLELSPASKDIASRFSSISAYAKEVPVLVGEDLLRIQVSVILCWTKTGVYAGYGSKLSLPKSIDHAFVEAIRNFSIHKNQKSKVHFPYNRIH